jgi:acetyl-CoA carboxylase carboxyltransferase component
MEELRLLLQTIADPSDSGTGNLIPTPPNQQYNIKERFEAVAVDNSFFELQLNMPRIL